MERWANRLREIISGEVPASNVVAMREGFKTNGKRLKLWCS